MTDFQINQLLISIDASSRVESNDTETHDLATIGNMTVRVADRSISKTDTPAQLVNFDLLIPSTGIDIPTGAVWNHHAIDVKIDSPPGLPQTVSSFFTNVELSSSLKDVFAIPREINHGIVTYDIFWLAPDSGATTLNLDIFTLSVPDGKLPIVPDVGGTVQRTVSVLRETRGERKIYDVFVLYNTP